MHEHLRHALGDRVLAVANLDLVGVAGAVAGTGTFSDGHAQRVAILVEGEADAVLGAAPEQAGHFFKFSPAPVSVVGGVHIDQSPSA